MPITFVLHGIINKVESHVLQYKLLYNSGALLRLILVCVWILLIWVCYILFSGREKGRKEERGRERRRRGRRGKE